MEKILELNEVSFSYQGRNRNRRTEILRDASYGFEAGKLYTVLGASGSGKTTTLALLGALERPASGKILYRGQDIREIGENAYRNQKVGIVFQAYNLLPYLTPFENVMAAMDITKTAIAGKKERALELLQKMGLDESLYHRNVNRLSGGEQQRVAIARALSTQAEILLADEPTGNLDDKTACEVMKIFQNLAHEDGKCVIAVTHSRDFAAMADVAVRLENGKLQERQAITEKDITVNGVNSKNDNRAK